MLNHMHSIRREPYTTIHKKFKKVLKYYNKTFGTMQLGSEKIPRRYALKDFKRINPKHKHNPSCNYSEVQHFSFVHSQNYTFGSTAVPQGVARVQA